MNHNSICVMIIIVYVIIRGESQKSDIELLKSIDNTQLNLNECFFTVCLCCVSVGWPIAQCVVWMLFSLLPTFALFLSPCIFSLVFLFFTEFAENLIWHTQSKRYLVHASQSMSLSLTVSPSIFYLCVSC